MNTQTRTLFLLALLMCLLIAWGGQMLLERRDKSEAKASQMAVRASRVTALAREVERLPRSSVRMPQNRTLFALVNHEVKRLGLSRHLEAVRPGQSEKQGRTESLLEFRLAGMYLRGVLDWVRAVEGMPGVRVIRMHLTRSGKALLDLDMAIARTEAAK